MFRLRLYKNIGWGILSSIPGFLIWWIYKEEIIGGLLAVIPALIVFYLLETRRIYIACQNSKCTKFIEADTPWQCGYDHTHRNENVAGYPFINECGYCHKVPKAYICHHCQAPIFFSNDQQIANAAVRLSESKPLPVRVVVKDVVGDKIVTQREEIRDLQHQLDKATIEKDIEIVKNKPITPANQNDQLVIEKEVDDDVAAGMSLFEIEKKMKAKTDKKYPSDTPEDHENRERMYSLTEKALLKQMAKREKMGPS